VKVFDLIQERRTIRRFRQDRIDYETLVKIVDAGRLAPSASNLQPLEYIIADEPEQVRNIFENTKWAGYLPKNLGRPPAGQEPVAFIVVLINRKIKASGGEHDVGAAVENMILTALEHKIGSCWIGSVDRDVVARLLNIPKHYEIDSVLALGYPAEEPVMEDMKDSIKYYRDEDGRLHVPKRPLQTILHHNTF